MKAKRPSTKIIIIAIACVATVIAVIYTGSLIHSNCKEKVISNTQQQLLTTAKAVASRIDDFIAEHTEVLKTVTMNPLIQEEAYNKIKHNNPDHTFCLIKNLYGVHKGVVDALTLLDSNGVMLHRHPFIKDRPGMDHTDKPGVAYVVREHKPYISQVFCNNLGNTAISISEPIFYKGEFAGIVRWMIETATLSKRFVEPVKIGDNGYAWMFDDRNIILSHPRKAFLGISVLDAIEKIHMKKGEVFDKSKAEKHIRAKLDYLNRVKQEKEGYGIFIDCVNEKEQIVSYTGISLEETTLNIVATLPYSEIVGPIQEHAKNTIIIAVAFMLMMTGGGVFLIRNEKSKSELKAETRHLTKIAESAEALRKNEEKLSGIIESGTDHMSMIDEQHNIVWTNDVTTGLFGADLVGKKCYMAYHGYDKPCEPCVVRKCFEDGKVHEHETEVIRADGNPITFWCTASVAAHDEYGRPNMVVQVSRDITERKRAEEALGESERRLKESQEIAQLGQWELDLVSDRLYWSEGIFPLFEIDPDKFGASYEAFLELVHPDDREFVDKAYTDSVRDKTPYNIVHRLLLKDGKIKYVNEICRTEYDEDGNPLRSLGTVQDITKYIQVEERLKKSEEKYRTLFEEARDAIFVSEAETGIIIDCNQAASVLVGRAKSEIVGKHQRILHPTEELEEEFSSTFKQHLEDKEGQTLDAHVITKDGKIRHVAIKANVFELKGKRFLLGIFHDITGRKRMEEALRKSEEKYQDLYDNAPDMYVSVDAETEKIIECNQTLADRLGYRKEEIIGRPVFDMYTPDSAEYSKRDVFPVFVKTGKIEGEELQLQRKDGTTVDVYLKASAIRDHQGNILYSISSWRDITEKKKLEAQLQHAQKLESIGTLTSGVAHNFRNILSPISLYSQLIQMTYKDKPQLQEMAEKTEECVRRGAQLVNGLMQFCRKHIKKIETIDLAEVLRETYDLITKSFDKKIDIRLDIVDSLLIRGDHSELSQVFMNLCTNARDAMPDGGKLSIEAGMEGDEALIAISDTGPGMDEQARRQCFDPFFTTKETDKGTGLGLSTAYGIVKDHGGEIQVFSELNNGTTFLLYFPLAFSDERQRQAGVHEVVKGSGEKVLIVDDEVDILEVLVKLTKRLGYSAAFADSGKAGFDKYKSWRPDVVLLDRNMPGMDGPSCALSILEYDPEARIVLISGYDAGGPSGIDEKTNALIKGYLTKPIKTEELSQIFLKVLDKD